MKRLAITLIGIAGSWLLNAQNPGQVGTYFENTIQMSNKNYGGRSGGNYNPNYIWNNPYSNGYAEFFLRIPEYGMYTVSIDGQTITSSTGMFRFFDINPRLNTKIEILRNNMPVYRAFITIKRNTRQIADFFTMKGLYLLAETPLNVPFNNGNYYDLWNDMWNGYYQPQGNHFYQNNWNPYYGLNGNFGQNNGYNNGYNNQPNYPNQPNFPNQPNYPNQPNQPNFPNNGMPRVMNQNAFNQFLQTVRNTSFDNSKEKFIQTQLMSNDFTTAQVIQLLKEFSFDSNRLTVAKMCYNTCADRQNYIQVVNTFTFESSKNELTQYMANQR